MSELCSSRLRTMLTVIRWVLTRPIHCAGTVCPSANANMHDDAVNRLTTMAQLLGFVSLPPFYPPSKLFPLYWLWKNTHVALSPLVCNTKFKALNSVGPRRYVGCRWRSPSSLKQGTAKRWLAGLVVLGSVVTRLRTYWISWTRSSVCGTAIGFERYICLLQYFTFIPLCHLWS